jgi:hypothetical protein
MQRGETGVRGHNLWTASFVSGNNPVRWETHIERGWRISGFTDVSKWWCELLNTTWPLPCQSLPGPTYLADVRICATDLYLGDPGSDLESKTNNPQVSRCPSGQAHYVHFRLVQIPTAVLPAFPFEIHISCNKYLNCVHNSQTTQSPWQRTDV